MKITIEFDFDVDEFFHSKDACITSLTTEKLEMIFRKMEGYNNVLGGVIKDIKIKE